MKKQTLTERFQELAGIKPLYTLDEEALGSDTPIGMADLDMDLAKTSANSGMGSGSPDVVTGGPSTATVGELKPAQKEVIAAKALCFALGNLRDGNPSLDDMGAIISNDNYIMDGHHRWSARTLIEPGASVKVTKIDLPANELITVLNIYTKGIKGKPTGNPGEGAIASFKSSIPKLIDQAMEEGTTNFVYTNGPWPKLTAEEVKSALAKVPGADGDAAKGAAKMKANANSLTTEIHPNAPSRINMPVIDAEEIPKVLSKLKAGEIDFHPEYSDATKAKLKGGGEKEKSPTKTDSVNEDLKGLMAQGEKIAAFANKQSGHEGGVSSPVRAVLAAATVAGAPDFNGDEDLKAYYTRKLTKAIETQKGKKYMSGFSESMQAAQESKDPRSSLFERMEKHINKK